MSDHSSLGRIRERYGVSIFQKFFERVVELCIAAGLVWGKELYFDGARIEANADIDQRISRFQWAVQQHLTSVFIGTEVVDESAEHGRSLIDKYDGKRIISPNTNAKYHRQADTHVCPTDSRCDASLQHVSPISQDLPGLPAQNPMYNLILRTDRDALTTSDVSGSCSCLPVDTRL